MNNRMTITEAAKLVGVCSKTIIRWELTGKVSKAKRDWRGWRVYGKEDVNELIRFHESINDAEEHARSTQIR